MAVFLDVAPCSLVDTRISEEFTASIIRVIKPLIAVRTSNLTDTEDTWQLSHGTTIPFCTITVLIAVMMRASSSGKRKQYYSSLQYSHVTQCCTRFLLCWTWISIH
jgi:hypothetical protein